MEKGEEGKERESGGMGREEGKGKGKGDGKRREAPENCHEPRFLPNFQLWGYCTYPILDLGQIWHVSAGPWYTLPCQISSCLYICYIYNHA